MRASEILRRAKAKAIDDGYFPFEAVNVVADKDGAQQSGRFLIQAIREGSALGWSRDNLAPLFDQAIALAKIAENSGSARPKVKREVGR